MSPVDAAPDVPERYHGVWKRTLLETPQGCDTTTWAHWLQTARWHADLRVPPVADEVRPAIPLGMMSAAQHLALSQQKGFLGRTEIKLHGLREVCTWHRKRDLQPPGLTPDAGWMEFEADDRVIETGVHGVYREVWERVPGSTGRTVVLAETRSSPDDEAAVLASARTYLLLAGECLMRVRPRQVDWPSGTLPGDALSVVLDRHPASATDLLDFEISYGRLRDGMWRIERSSLPELEGRTEAMHWQRLDDTRAEVHGASGISVWCVMA